MKIKEFVITKARKLYKTGALHITLGTFFTKFVAFFGSIVVVRLLSKEEYGVLSFVENIYSYALIFAAFGMSNAVLRYIIIADTDIEKKQYFIYIIDRSIKINFGIAIILVVISQIMPISEKYSAARYLIPILAVLLPFQDLLNDGLFTIRSFFKNQLYAYIAFASSTVLILGRIIGAKIAGVDGVILSRVVINALFAISVIYYARNSLFTPEKVVFIDKEKQKTVNHYSFQYMITNGFWAIFMLNDKFLLGLLLDDPAGLADYNVASVLPGTITIFATAIGTFVGPYFTRNEKNLEWVRRNYKKVVIVNATVVGFIALVIGVSADTLIRLMYGNLYVNTISLMRVLLIGAFFNSGIRYTTANLLAAMGEVKYNMIISGLGIIIQISLDLILIPYMGVMAVAVSNCAIFLLMAIALYFIFYKMFFSKNAIQ